MGRATSVVFFCLALDQLIWALHDVSSFIRLTAYMDDNSAASKGLQWVKRAQNTFEPAHSAGLQVLRHHCFQAGFISMLTVRERMVFYRLLPNVSKKNGVPFVL